MTVVPGRALRLTVRPMMISPGESSRASGPPDSGPGSRRRGRGACPIGLGRVTGPAAALRQPDGVEPGASECRHHDDAAAKLHSGQPAGGPQQFPSECTAANSEFNREHTVVHHDHRITPAGRAVGPNFPESGRVRLESRRTVTVSMQRAPRSSAGPGRQDGSGLGW
eukprot:765129-Hanusia_phi.AAC.2